MKKILWVIVVVLALLIGYVPVHYLINGVEKGYLELKSQEVLHNNIWWTFLYTHITSGGIAILIGWLQFSDKLRTKRPNWHRSIGKIYVISALICSISGFYIGYYATGGLLAGLGFMSVAVIYFYTTLQGYLTIRKKHIVMHQNYMTYSYAACLAAVSLRILVPLSFIFTDDYIFSYTLIAWFAWIPNLGIAYWVNRGRLDEATYY